MKLWKKRTAALLLAAAAAVCMAAPAAAGWQKEQTGFWRCLDESGAPLTGWHYIDGSWYYFNDFGRMQTGWFWQPEGWYHFSANGAMAVGWRYIDGSWYYFNSSGQMQTGWLYAGDHWYCLALSGQMKTGWLEQTDGTYYLDETGAMVSGKREIDGAIYTFGEDGRLVYDSGSASMLLLAEVNRYRAAAGIPALSASVSLNSAASIRAEEAARHFSHTRPDGRPWHSVLDDIGQENLASGENLASNYQTAKDVAAAWMKSDSHRKNMLNPQYQYMGCAAFEREDGTVFWAQLFTDRLN